jgi:uncharacterized protein YecE (DUF72 family)
MLKIGTSGWNYKSWKERFYPKDLPASSYLEYYSHEFDTAELNYSFYRLPNKSTYEHWASTVPQGFIFALKVSRFITHIKRLSNISEPWRIFTENAEPLKEHKGPLLLQLPENFHADAGKLRDFLSMAESSNADRKLRLVFEFRHDSWLNKEIYDLLEQYNAALCVADSPRYPRRNIITADFVYFRYHGRDDLFRSWYSDEELRSEARAILKLVEDGLDVYVYFNNDFEAHAVRNARTLKQLTSKLGSSRAPTHGQGTRPLRHKL